MPKRKSLSLPWPPLSIPYVLCLLVLLAAGFIIFGKISLVTRALLESVINPLIALVMGKPDFSAIRFSVYGTVFPIGNLITALLMFALTGAVVYFLVILPAIALMTRLNQGEESADPTTKQCPECLGEIPIAAHKCAYCTSVVA